MKVYVTLAVDVPSDTMEMATAVLNESNFSVTFQDEKDETNEMNVSVLDYKDSFTI